MDITEVQPKDNTVPESSLIVPSAATSTTPESPLHIPESTSERWNSLRQWISNLLEDEKAAPMPRLPPKKKKQQQQQEQRHPMHDWSAEELASFRARRISVTLCKESADSKWGFSLQQHASKASTVQIKRMAKKSGTLLEYAPFQSGDILVSINGQPCTDAKTTIQQLVEMKSDFPITLLVETPHGDPNAIQVVVHKPALSTLGIRFFPTSSNDLGGDEGTKSSTDDTNGSSTTQDTQPSPEDKGTTFPPLDSLLRIQCIEPHGILAHSPLRQGDVVVAINATPCSQMFPDQALALLQESGESVTLIAIQPSLSRQQQWLRQARRAGVAIGGGTMVGIGLIFIPTLPPPFGEALLVGGVSVLGTEFETPKKIMKSARDSFERVVGCEDEEAFLIENNNGDDDDPNSNVPSNELQRPNKSGATTMKGRVKTFGRRHVLPLLNQAVGDRQENMNSNR